MLKYFYFPFIFLFSFTYISKQKINKTKKVRQSYSVFVFYLTESNEQFDDYTAKEMGKKVFANSSLFNFPFSKHFASYFFTSI